jgi:transposase
MERRELSKVTMEHLSIDEKSFKEGHNYVSVLSHPKTGTVIDVSDGRDTRAVDMLFETALTQEQRESVRTISLDMWKPYMNSSEDNLPNAEMVHDKFHLVAYLNKSIDLVRRREVKKNEELKYTRFIFLKTPINLTERQQEKFELIKRANFEVTHAWECCQNFKDLFEQCSEENEAATLLFSWIGDVYKKCIKEVSKVAQMFARHARGVINAMMTNINNAMAERLNGKIQEIKTSGRGYRTFESFRSAILFWNGGLDLYPRNWA